MDQSQLIPAVVGALLTALLWVFKEWWAARKKRDEDDDKNKITLSNELTSLKEITNNLKAEVGDLKNLEEKISFISGEMQKMVIEFTFGGQEHENQIKTINHELDILRARSHFFMNKLMVIREKGIKSGWTFSDDWTLPTKGPGGQ